MSPDEELLPLNDKDQIDDWIEQALRARPFQSDNQHDRPDPQLIQELHDYYEASARAVHDRLQRVWQRLEQRAGRAMQGQRQDPSAAGPVFLQERRHPMQRPLPPVRRRWPSRLSALVAAVLLIALVSGLTIGLILVRHTGNQGRLPESAATSALTPTSMATPAPTNTPTSVVRMVPVLETLHMLDAQHGWALNLPERVEQTSDAITITTTNQYEVLTTSDGGNHWQDVTPPHLQGPVIPNFITASLAWLFVGDNQLYLTTDGGQTWQQRTVPAERPGSLISFTFINDQDGWILLLNENPVSPSEGTFTLFRTTDGGRTWYALQSTDAQGKSPPGALPLKHIRRLTFVDASTGWATGENARSDGFVRLYMTQDGGVTWQLKQLPLPAQGFSGPTVDAQAPEFFNAQDGILDVASNSVNFQPLAAHLPGSGVLGRVIYVTHDGGATWESGALLPDPQGSVSFSDANHGWVVAGPSHDLWATSDGGRTWTRLSSRRLAANALDFVSSQSGWASLDDSLRGTLLFKTEDGGHTWTQIPYSISR